MGAVVPFSDMKVRVFGGEIPGVSFSFCPIFRFELGLKWVPGTRY